MMNWVESHGMECVTALFLFSLITSVMPAYGTPHFFRLWGYNVISTLGANAGNIVKHTPAGQKIESFVGTTVEQQEDGTKTKTDVSVAALPATTSATLPATWQKP
jgi:hypothetical protein